MPLHCLVFDDGRGAARAASHRLPRRAREPRRLPGPLRRPSGVPARTGGPTRCFREARARSGLAPFSGTSKHETTTQAFVEGFFVAVPAANKEERKSIGAG